MSDSRDPQRPIEQLVPDLEGIRHALMPVIRRLRVATVDERHIAIRALYEDVPGMRACAKALTEIVDDMCKLCFPLAITPLRKSIMAIAIRHEPIYHSSLIDHVGESLNLAERRETIVENITQLVDAGYLRHNNGHMLVSTATGKAANAGIFWAQP